MTKHDGIPTAEIEQDILDTEREIAQMEIEAAHSENAPMCLSSARLDHMRAAKRRQDIEERKVFIGKLRKILADRQP
jgi:hypothetical protein